MISSQWCFPPKVGVDGELMSEKSLSPKTCKLDTAFLLTAHCLALPGAESSHGLNLPVTWIPKALAADQVMACNGWPNLMWRLLVFFLGMAVADTAFLLYDAYIKSTPATQPLRVLIWWSRMMSPFGVLITLLFRWSHEILFPCNSLHLREKWFAPALGQNITGHRVWTCSVPLTCHILTHSLPFFVAGIIQEPWCTRISDPGILPEQKECVTINGTHHTSLRGLFHIFGELNCFLFIFFCFTFTHQWT